jgi:hypothetical protein
MYAPIFYDSNDTTYYVDPNADLSARFYGEICNSNYQPGVMQPGSLNIGRTDLNYGWAGSTWASDVRLGILANCSETWEFGIHDSGDSVMSALHFDGGTQFIIGRDIGWGTCYLTNPQSMRAPIFYDSDNTGYYIDAASTSVLNALTLGGRSTNLAVFYEGFTLDANTMSTNATGFTYAVNAPYTGPIARFSAGSGTYDMWFNAPYSANGYGLAFRTRNGDTATLNPWRYPAVYDVNVNGGGALYATIYYDQGNTAYYADPASNSNLYSLTLSGNTYFQPNSWIQFNGAYGLYWPSNNDAHLVANTNSSYGQLEIRGSRNSYGGIFDLYSGVNGVMYDSGGNGGIYRESIGRWYQYHNVANNCTGFGTSATDSAFGIYVAKGIYSVGRVDGSIFYDNGNTAYYLDPNGTSALSTVTFGSSPTTGGGGGQIVPSVGSPYSVRQEFGSDNTGWRYGVAKNVGGTVTVLFYVQDTGDCVATGNLTAYSDVRVKDNIETVSNALHKLASIRGVTYTRTDLDDKERRYAGVIAQEIEQVLPEAVGGDEHTKTVDYNATIALLIQAVKELSAEVQALKAKE